MWFERDRQCLIGNLKIWKCSHVEINSDVKKVFDCGGEKNHGRYLKTKVIFGAAQNPATHIKPPVLPYVIQCKDWDNKLGQCGPFLAVLVTITLLCGQTMTAEFQTLLQNTATKCNEGKIWCWNVQLKFFLERISSNWFKSSFVLWKENKMGTWLMREATILLGESVHACVRASPFLTCIIDSCFTCTCILHTCIMCICIMCACIMQTYTHASWVPALCIVHHMQMHPAYLF